MVSTFYLTPAEGKLFSALPEKLREGWDVEEETMEYQDTPVDRRVRLNLMDFQDPQFKNLMVKCRPGCSEEEIEEYVLSMNLSSVGDKDLAEICYVLGPEGLGFIVGKLLSQVKTDGDMDSVCALTELRHVLLSSLQPV